MADSPVRETELYAPVKALLRSQGYQVKAEIGPADVVAIRDGEDPVIVELKTGFSLALFHQAIERQAITNAVYVGVPRGRGRAFQKSLRKNTKLCRLLGIGLLIVRLKDGNVDVLVDPAPYKPRKSKFKTGRLLREFQERSGDPNVGGSHRSVLVTAYRQDAIRCLQVLLDSGPTKASKVAEMTNVERARNIMADNHYGWFERVTTGIYTFTEAGRVAADQYTNALVALQTIPK